MENRKPIGRSETMVAALRIHRAAIVIDGHNDLPWKIRSLAGSSFDVMDIALPQDRLQTDIPRLRRGGLGGQFWVVYVPPATAHTGAATSGALEQFDLIHRMVKRYSTVFELARTAQDITRIHQEGRVASLIGVEGGHTIESSLDTLARFYELGARYMGLTHSETIDWADSATDQPRSNGLSAFGEQVVLEMNRLGMLVDLAHVSAETMRDALRVSHAPVIFSHSSAYAIARHDRNVPDDVLRLVAKNGGVVMVNFYSGFIHPKGALLMADCFQLERRRKTEHRGQQAFERASKLWKDAQAIPQGNVGTLVNHIDHIVRVAGIDHVGLGGDYDGADTMPEGLEDVSGYPNITQELLDRGYCERDIHKILGGNLLRALRQAEQVSGKSDG
jgi:membrane dipeptidase